MAEGTVGVKQATIADRFIDNELVTNRDGTAVYRQRVAVGASLDRVLTDYAGRTDGNAVYVGFNAQTAVIADPTWLVFRLSYDASARLIDKQVLVGAWTGRAALLWRAAGGN